MQIEKPRNAVPAREVHGGLGPGDGWLESDLVDNVIARRNALMALWAGREMGLDGPAMSTYAGRVHSSDLRVAGDSDLIGRVCRDLAAHGLHVREADVMRKLSEFHKEALRQSISTD